MTWRDQLLPASFRGAAFEWDGASAQGQRSIVIHRYPLVDQVETEDLGGGVRQIALTGYVLGPEYMAARDALIAALDQAGAGALVHPTRGRMQALCLGYECSETSQMGGMAVFRMQFIRMSAVTQPAGTVDTGAAVATAATAARAASAASFGTSYSASGLASADALSALLQTTLARGAKLIDNSQAFTSRQTGTLVNALLDPVHGARQLLDQTVGLPADVYAQIDDLFNGLTNATNLRGLFDAYQSVSVPSPSSPQTLASATAVQQVLRTETVTRLAQAMTAIQYASYDEAEAALQDALACIDTLGQSADAANYAALQDLRVALFDDITTRDADLRRITHFTASETAPALTIAQRLYGCADIEANAADVVARNGIFNPLFVPGGVALEVLTP